jgi:predicted amidophosphoribosyltransferase
MDLVNIVQDREWIGCILHRVTEERALESWDKFSLLPRLNSCACCGGAVLPHHLACGDCWD